LVDGKTLHVPQERWYGSIQKKAVTLAMDTRIQIAGNCQYDSKKGCEGMSRDTINHQEWRGGSERQADSVYTGY